MSSALYNQPGPSRVREPRAAMAASPLVVLAGPPGAGKGTQCNQLAERHGMVHVSIGEVLRQEVANSTSLGLEICAFLEAGKLVPDAPVSAVVAERLALHRASTVLLDGFPRTVRQAEMLEEFRPDAVRLVVLLVLPIATVFRRLCTRGRADDNDPQAVTRRLLAYDRDTKPAFDLYASRGLLVHVDASAPIHEVTARIEVHLAALGL